MKKNGVKRQIAFVVEYVQCNDDYEVCKLMLPNGQCLAVFDDAADMADALLFELRRPETDSACSDGHAS